MNPEFCSSKPVDDFDWWQILLLINLTLSGCWSSDAPPPVINSSNPTINSDDTSKLDHRIRFVEKTARTGINFVPRNGAEADEYTILETLGTGVAFLDVDADGWEDLLFPGGGTITSTRTIVGRPPGLFRNLGEWQFDDITTPSGLHSTELYSHGAAATDFDNDGFRDVLITGYQGAMLYRNLGDGTFDEQPLSTGSRESIWSTTAAWGDLNNDGHPDVYVARYLDWSFKNHPQCISLVGATRDNCAPFKFKGLPDAVFYNEGNGRFRETTFDQIDTEGGKGLAVAIADLDADRDLDVYVANDAVPNMLYRNEGAETFREVGVQSGTALDAAGESDGSMGISIGDFNQDGRPDIWVTNYQDQSFALYDNTGDLTFRHVSDRRGIDRIGVKFVGWGTEFADFDHDGDEDLVAVTGHVMRTPVRAPIRQQPILLENLDGESFFESSGTAGPFFSNADMSRGAATGDLDRDGDIDIAISRLNEPVAILSNESKTVSPSIKIRLIGTLSPREPVGAMVEWVDSQQRSVRWIIGGGSYLSTRSPLIHLPFQAPKKNSPPPRLRITWPSGRTQEITMPNGLTDILTVIENAARRT